MSAVIQPGKVPGTATAPGETSGARLAVRRFLRNRLAVVGLAFVVLFFLFCFIGPLVYSTDQTHTLLDQVNQSPSGAHWLGTDAVGHDELGRLMYGGKVSLIVGLAAGVLATVIGTLWGATAGYAGGWIDAFMMRVVDAGIAIPALFILLVVSAITTPGLSGLVVILGLVSWLVPSRLVRAETLTLKNRDYVLTLRAIGGTHGRAILRHILPNSVSTVIVAATFQIADAILLVAYVSYLGLGVQPPQTDWGGMLSAGLTAAYSGYWWLILPPGLAIIVVVWAFNAIGDGLRDAFDVRGRG
ncbi:MULTISPECIES: ABC transporter permease [Streptomyces]|uniref:ABC transporter permease n=1 Tax=Streptomyces evansiae TaxID=3075535 RepID=A0ABU2QVB4_9ACTN|nr:MULTISPECIES: ABC transporter permease [unclassified Streptomyces]EFK98539.1 nickel ABC transporter, permease subunit NikC [Streptomyces sp. SPB78]MDT0408383.1 ABC transporter permease [Streptomyces sp. DSM 41979]MDT0422057.1 ABC transporter permease [Streptomyces sp. DSM 41859]MYQ59264.1 ABC transporter permease subunit [Streptomyces sp. SID4926]NJA60373.1 ABC transporter permease [Streptomyces sp. NEAU-H3]